MPPNAISVTRPGRWGNPFKVGDYVKIGNGKRQGEFGYIKTTNEYANKSYIHLDTIEKVLDMYEKYLSDYPPFGLYELTGKNLACWCKPGSPCHADILLKLANPTPDAKH